jgi:hypothetical protein
MHLTQMGLTPAPRRTDYQRMRSQRITITVSPPELLERVREAAVKERRSFSQMVRVLLEEALNHRAQDEETF